MEITKMGYLGAQPPRPDGRVTNEDLEMFIYELKHIAKECNLSFEAVLETRKVLGLERKNDFLITDGDYKEDKHIALHSITCPGCGLRFTVIFECKIATTIHINGKDLDESRKHN